jgi:hypothetical protein
MADINIEKKRTSIWPWIIGLLLLAAVIYAAWMFLGNDVDTAAEPAAPMQEYQAPPAPTPAPAPMDTTTLQDTTMVDTAGTIGP